MECNAAPTDNPCSQRKSSDHPDRLLTIEEVAELTGLAVGTLYHHVSERKIPVIRFSRRCLRFRLSDLREWFEKSAVYPESEKLSPTHRTEHRRKKGNEA
jgi:excisionase family DNA binding protein